MSGEPTTPDTQNLNPENYQYFSPRDNDGDGTAETIHAIEHDGTANIFHLNEDGDVVLQEIDSDGDGTYDAQKAPVDEETVAFGIDTDGDGVMDTLSYADKETNQTIQQDTYNEEGQIVETRIDADGDGITDVILRDTDGDGNFDEISLDTDKDGFVNTRMVDTDGDGQIDEMHHDADNTDGVLETTFTNDDYAGGLGSIDEYTDLIPFTDSSAGALFDSEIDDTDFGAEF